MKKLYLLIFTMCLIHEVWAQSTVLPQNKHNPVNLYTQLRDYLDELPFEYSLGYAHTNLVNPVYGDAVKNSNMKLLYGYYFNMRYNGAFPLILEMGGTNSLFETQKKDYFNFLANEKIAFKGFEVNANFVLLPSAKFFMPYIGVGYGFYNASTGGSVFDSESKRIYSEKAYSPFFKAGATINLHSTFYINAEYKQSFSNDKAFDFGQVNAGIGFRMRGSSVFRGRVKDDFDDQKLIFTYGYHQTEFLNAAFKQNIKDGNIKKVWGHAFNLRIAAAYPLMIDLGWFSSQYRIENLAGWKNDTIKVRHRGCEVAVVLPLLSKTKYFIPYIGPGFQISQLYTGPPFIQESGKDYSKIVKMAKNTSSAIYKAGIMFNFNLMAYSIEFKHSLFNDKVPFYQLSANIGIRF